MASILVPDSRAETTPIVTAGSGSTSKLRETCQACASSKVKCNKEKPTCSRCAKRGTPCEYYATKRPGRKRGQDRSAYDSGVAASFQRQSPSNSHAPWEVEEDSRTTGVTFSPNAPRLATPPRSSASTHSWIASTGDCTDPMAETFTDLFMPLDTSQSIDTMRLRTDCLDQPLLDLIDPELLDPDHSTHTSTDVSILLMPSETSLTGSLDMRDIGSISLPNPTPPHSGNQAPSLHDDGSGGGIPGPDCSCLPRALELMRKVSPTTTKTDYQKIGSEATNSLNSGTPFAEDLVEENKRIIDEVSLMLQCFCEGDVYLTTLMSMIVFKVLERFATAAKYQPREDTDTAESLAHAKIRLQPSPLLKNRQADLRRLAGQLVLRELHAVQQLVNKLAPRLKAEGAKAAIKGFGFSSDVEIASGDLQSVARQQDLGGEAKRVPFSATTLDHIEHDMRKCLSRLSADIINGLRHI